MNYSAIAQKIQNAVKPIGSYVSSIKNISFDSIWSGDAHDTLTTNLRTSLDKIKKQENLVNVFANAMINLQTYKDNKEKIIAYRNQYNRLDPEDDRSQRNNLSRQISNLESANASLRSRIESALNSISSVGTDFEVVVFEHVKDYKEYIVDLYDFLKLFQSGSLTKLSDSNSKSDSLYDFYTQEEVDQRLSDIKKQYSGRDAAVNCALGIMQMAAEVGKKLDYDYGGGHVEVTGVEHVARGVDCSSFASWAINQGTNSTFNTLTTSGLIHQGKQTTYEKAQKGDILVSSHHVVMIVANDPDKQEFLVAEAANSNEGVVMKTRSYASMSGAYQARDLSSIYNT